MATVNRRTFLKVAGANAGALAFAGDGVIASATPVPAPVQAGAAAGASDVVVIGAGAFGGWTALYLREMGRSVTMIDQYGPGNSRASSGGENRQIRAGYGDREVYTRWCLEAFTRWEARQKEWGKTLFFRTGQLSLARDWTKNLTDTRGMFDKLKVPYEVVQPDQIRQRYPQIAPEDGQFGFYTPTTGVLKAREGCVAVAYAFEKKGGKFLIARTSLGKQAGGRLQDVSLSTGQTVSAATYVFALGPWLPKMFPQLIANKLQVPAGSSSSTARHRATSGSPIRTSPPGRSAAPTGFRASRVKASRWPRPSTTSWSILTSRSAS
jgi:glycine/D-amino acid oxidase-like deaminating enzyme